jgi:uncharacterized protein YfdQ (DUF2303 family)
MAGKEQSITVGTPLSEAATVAGIVADAAKAKSEVKVQRTHEAGAPFTVLVGRDGEQRIESLSNYEAPRKKAAVAFVEQESFVEYVTLYAGMDTRVFCDLDKASFLAVIDYHRVNAGDAEGRRGEHRATLQLRFAEGFTAWQAVAKQPVSQAVLAEFLEDHYADITEPEGAEILELVKTLEVNNDVAFKSAQRSSDGGYNLNYQETVTAKAGQAGTIEVPSKLLLELQVFQGGRVMELPVRIRFRLDGGRVFFGLTFLGIEKLLRDEVARVRHAIAANIGREVWAGSVQIG